MELANIVADSRYKLYDDFLHLYGRRLGEYLDAVRRATIAGLEGEEDEALGAKKISKLNTLPT